MALPALACYYNYDSRVKNAKVEEKEKEKLIKLIESLEAAMEERNIQELQHFVNLDFPTEVYCVVGVTIHAHQANKNELPQNNKNKLGYHKNITFSF